MRKMLMRLVLKFLKPCLHLDVINAKFVQKGLEFVHYVPAVIERLKSITIQYLRRAIHFSGQLLNITKPLSFTIPYFFVVTSLATNLIRKGLNGYITF